MSKQEKGRACPGAATLNSAHLDGEHFQNNSGSSAAQALPVVVAVIEKNSPDEVRVIIDEWRGHHLIDIRIFSDFGRTGEKRPTRKGVVLKVEKLCELIDGLETALAEARRLGLIE